MKKTAVLNFISRFKYKKKGFRESGWMYLLVAFIVLTVHSNNKVWNLSNDGTNILIWIDTAF